MISFGDYRKLCESNVPCSMASKLLLNDSDCKAEQLVTFLSPFIKGLFDTAIRFSTNTLTGKV